MVSWTVLIGMWFDAMFLYQLLGVLFFLSPVAVCSFPVSVDICLEFFATVAWKKPIAIATLVIVLNLSDSSSHSVARQCSIMSVSMASTVTLPLYLLHILQLDEFISISGW